MLNKNEMTETCERLKAYPKLLEKVKEVLDLVEEEEVKSADDFEEKLIPQVRKFGQNIMETWAFSEEEKMKEKLEKNGVAHHSKKNSTGKLPLET